MSIVVSNIVESSMNKKYHCEFVSVTGQPKASNVVIFTLCKRQTMAEA